MPNAVATPRVKWQQQRGVSQCANLVRDEIEFVHKVHVVFEAGVEVWLGSKVRDLLEVTVILRTGAACGDEERPWASKCGACAQCERKHGRAA